MVDTTFVPLFLMSTNFSSKNASLVCFGKANRAIEGRGVMQTPSWLQLTHIHVILFGLFKEQWRAAIVLMLCVLIATNTALNINLMLIRNTHKHKEHTNNTVSKERK